MYVVDGLKTRVACHDSTTPRTNTNNNIASSIFKGLDNLEEGFVVIGFCTLHPMTCCITIRSKVEQELAQMESMGIISKVNEPTPWSTGMVVVPKKSGAV